MESQRATEGLVGLLSHDLKTPLGPLTLAVSNLAEGPWDACEARAVAQIALAQTDRLRRLIDAALIASGRLPQLRPERVSFGDVVLEAASTYQRTGGEVLLEPLPGTIVFADRAALRDAIAGAFEVLGHDGCVVRAAGRSSNARTSVLLTGGSIERAASALVSEIASDSSSVFALAAEQIASACGGGIEIIDEGLVIWLPDAESLADSSRASELGTQLVLPFETGAA